MSKVYKNAREWIHHLRVTGLTVNEGEEALIQRTWDAKQTEIDRLKKEMNITRQFLRGQQQRNKEENEHMKKILNSSAFF